MKKILLIFHLALGLYLDLSAQITNRSGKDHTIFVSNTVFLDKTTYSSGDQNWDIAKGDFNKDGSIDIATCSKLDGQINVHINKGDGSFAFEKSYPSASQNRSITTIDVNNDGNADLATSTMDGKIAIILNEGDAIFGKARLYDTGKFAQDIYASDLNKDGFTDILVASVNDNGIFFHPNLGNSRFGEKQKLISVQKARSVAIYDMDQDGDLDLVIGNDSDRILIFYQETDLTFSRKQTLRSGSAIWALGVADFNKDGWADIAAASYLDKQLCIHLSQGPGAYSREKCISSGDHNVDLQIQDFDLDGDMDVVTASTVDNEIGFHLNDGLGNMSERHELVSGKWNSAIATADYDGDGDYDLAVSSINDNSINIHKNISVALPEHEVQRPCIRGKIYFEDTKAAVKHTPISLRTPQNEGIETRLSDIEGRFEFCPQPNRTYNLHLRKQDFPPQKVEVVFGIEDIWKEIVLSKPSSSFVFGEVRDIKSNRTIKNAKIAILSQEGDTIGTSFTDQYGAYKHYLPLASNYEVTASKTRFTSDQKYFDLTQDHIQHGRRVNLRLEIDTKKMTACKEGQILDKTTGLPIPQAKILVTDTTGWEIKKGRANLEGEYGLRLPFGHYGIQIRKKGYFYKYEEISFTELESGDCKERDYELIPLEKGISIVLEHIFYDVDKADLRPLSIKELERLTAILNDNPSIVVEIGSHTDSDASDQYNLALSERRAASVVNYLIDAGISKDRLLVKGYGESMPMVENDSDANKQLNRRTEFKVIDY